MAPVDRRLLELAPGDRVSVLPTAAGLEDPGAWGRMGVDHFRRLGARPVHVALHHRRDAEDPALLGALAETDLFYLSGGSPDHLLDSLAGTAAWDLITVRLAEGAVIAGCSAGTTALGSWSVSVAQKPWGWRQGLGLLRGWGLLPHYDAAPDRPAGIEEVLASVPVLDHLVGIDEGTVLLWDGSAWSVMGRARVVLVQAGKEFRATSRLPLPPPGVADEVVKP